MNYWQGERVRLRALEPADAAFFVRCNLDSERARCLDFLWPPQSGASVQAWVDAQSMRKLENDTFNWMIETLDGTPVGSISTHDCNPRAGTFSYGIDVAPEHRGQRFAEDAVRLVLRYYFDELRYQKVTVVVHADNPASIRLHERLGFQLEGRLRRMVFTQSQYVDALWFGLTCDEFRNLAPVLPIEEA
jgi:RimJ/RimL family protein N-acetyltransferase